MMTDDEILKVVQAHKEGKKIQYRNYPDSIWRDVMDDPITWCFCNRGYRVSPEPCKPLKEIWLQDEGNGTWKEIGYGIGIHFRVVNPNESWSTRGY